MKASSGVILCVTNSNTVICYKLSVDREHSLDLRVCSHKLFFVNLHHVKIYLCNIPPRAVLMLSFSKLLSYLFFFTALLKGALLTRIVCILRMKS